MKMRIIAILISILSVNTAQAEIKISIRPFCYASGSLMTVFTVIEGTTVRKNKKSQEYRFIFKASCDLSLSTCTTAEIDLKNLEVSQPLDVLDVAAINAPITRLKNNVYEINSGLAAVYTIDLAKKTVTYRMSLPDFGRAKAQESTGKGRCY